MAPIFPLLAAVILGIISARFFLISKLVWYFAFGLSIALLSVHRLKVWPIFVAFFSLAALHSSIVQGRLQADPLRFADHQKLILVLRSRGDSDSKRFVADVMKLFVSGHWININSRVLVYSPQTFSGSERFTAQGELEGLPRKLNFYHQEGCHHSFHIERILRVEESKSGIWGMGSCARRRINQKLSVSLQSPADAVAAGVLLGDHSRIESDLLDDFRVTGTYHILVASGLKVALVAGAAWLFSWWFPFHWRLAASALAVAGYAGLVGFGPPVLRASLMALLGFLAFALGRGKESLGALFLAALILLIAKPLWLFDVGFQLSFLSVLGILLFVEKISRWLFFFPKWIADSIAVTLSAQLLILAPLAVYFHNVSFISPLANLLVVPLTAISMFLGSLSFVSWTLLGFVISFWHQRTLNLMIWIVEHCARIPHAYVWVTSPGWDTVVLIYLFFFGLLIFHQRIGKALMIASAVILGMSWIFRSAISPETHITFLDVGQGDSTILTFDRKHYLVDGGGSSTEILRDGFSVGERIVVPALRAHGINRLDGILLTHPHRDHVGGLIAVLKQFPVKEIWLAPLRSNSAVYSRFLSIAREKNIPLVTVRGGEKLQIGQQDWVYFDWPIAPFLRGTVSDLNNNSVVSQWKIDGVSILLSGDVEVEGERETLRHLRPRGAFRSQILKVPHHGSGTSSTIEFLKAVSPEVAVVSVGEKNLYHHPSPRTMARLHRLIPHVFRTDQDGTIELVIHHSRFSTELERK